jgi:hypothetical protein
MTEVESAFFGIDEGTFGKSYLVFSYDNLSVCASYWKNLRI